VSHPNFIVPGRCSSRGFRLVLSRGSLTLEKPESSRGNLDSVVLVEERLERKNLTGRQRRGENSLELALKGTLPVASSLTRLRKRERLHIASGHAPKSENVPRLHHRNHCDWICPARARELSSSCRHPEKNHRVRIGIDDATGNLNGSIAGVSERAQQIRDGCRIIVRLCDNCCRRRIDFIE